MLLSLYLFDMFAKESLSPLASSKNEEIKRKVIDSVYGNICFDNVIWDFIDTPHFQRLLKLKQLGTLNYVFPYATHTRYDHSIGTAHLARTFIEKLIENNPEKYIHQDLASAIKTVILAGLLHGIGYSPFCQAFDTQVVTQIKKPNGKYTKWNHMIARDLLIESIFEIPHLHRHLTFFQKQRIKALIKGIPVGQRKWQFQIINNKKCGLDVNILNSLIRNAHFLQAKNIYINHHDLMIEARIIEDQICYPTKIADDIFGIYRSHYLLFKNYHFNIVNKGVELMIIDILKLVKDKFKIQQICASFYANTSNYQAFLGLTDNILDQIEKDYQNMLKQQVKDEKDMENFKKAVILLERLKNRDVYTFVKELKYYMIDKIDVQVTHLLQKDLKKQKMIKQISQQIAMIHPEYIKIAIDNAGYGHKQYNPMKNVKFFVKQDPFYKIIEQTEAQKLFIFRTFGYNQRSIKFYVSSKNQQLYLRVESALSEFQQKFNQNIYDKIKKQTGLFYLVEGNCGKPPRNDHRLSLKKQQLLFPEQANKKIAKERSKIMRNITSPIFEVIQFDQMIWDFVDTPEFQRLHKIKQLGCMHFMFPSCTHTVFQQSLGTAFLAEKMMVKLIEHHPQLYTEDEKIIAIKTVTLAGLLKKIGQSPFDGIFDEQLTNQEEIKGKWCQQASIAIFNRMIKQPKLRQHLSDEQIQRVKDLIKGVSHVEAKRVWQFDVINNTKNGLDVALFQQLKSISHQLQLKIIQIDHDRLFEQARIVDEEISYPTEYFDTILNIFQSSYKIQKYYHYDPTIRSIQIMMVDIMKLVKEKLNLEETYRILIENNDNSLYQQHTDDIFGRIEDIYHMMLQYESQDKNIPHFQKAIKLKKRITDRKFYLFVKELRYEVPKNQNQLDQDFLKFSLTSSQIKKKILEYLDKMNVDFEIDIIDASFGLPEENPVKKVSFFKQEDFESKKILRKIAQYQLQQLSMLFTDGFVEKSIKVFLKQDKPDNLENISLAIEQMKKQYKSNYIVLGQSGINSFSNNSFQPQSLRERSLASVHLPK